MSNIINHCKSHVKWLISILGRHLSVCGYFMKREGSFKWRLSSLTCSLVYNSDDSTTHYERGTSVKYICSTKPLQTVFSVLIRVSLKYWTISKYAIVYFKIYLLSFWEWSTQFLWSMQSFSFQKCVLIS